MQVGINNQHIDSCEILESIVSTHLRRVIFLIVVAFMAAQNLRAQDGNQEILSQLDKQVAALFTVDLDRKNRDRFEIFNVSIEALKSKKVSDKEALRLYESIVNVQDSIGFYCVAHGELTVAELLLNGSRFIRSKKLNGRGLDNTKSNIEIATDEKTNTQQLREHIVWSLSKFNQIGNKRLVAECYFEIGALDLLTGYFQSALMSHTNALRIYEELKDTAGITAVYQGIGTVYSMQGAHDKSLEFWFRELDLRSGFSDKRDVAGHLKALINTATAYENTEDSRSAELIYATCIQDFEPVRHKFKGYIQCCYNLGALFEKENKTNEAFSLYEHAIYLSTQRGYIMPEAARAYIGTGRIKLKQGKVKEAIKRCTVGLSHGQKEREPLIILEAAYTLYQAYDQNGEYKKALEMLELWGAMGDSIGIEKNYKNAVDQQYAWMYEQQVALDSAKYHKQVAFYQIENEKELQKQKWFYSIVVGISFLIIGWGYKAYSKKAKANKLLEKDKQELQSEIDRYLKERQSHQKRNTASLEADEIAILNRHIKSYNFSAKKLTIKDIETINTILNHPYEFREEWAERLFISLDTIKKRLGKLYPMFNMSEENDPKKLLLEILKILNVRYVLAKN